MNITTRTTIVSNVQLDDNITIRLLEEGFKCVWSLLSKTCERRKACYSLSLITTSV